MLFVGGNGICGHATNEVSGRFDNSRREDRISRRVSADNTANRLDPEFLVTPTEVFIYYTELANARVLTRRCITGLGPSQE